MKNILVIWSWSYLAEDIEESLFPMHVEKINHIYNLNTHFLTKFDTIINFTIQPEFSERILGINDLIDVQLAKILQWTSTSLVMLSSRKVYWLHKNLDIIKESDNLSPFDFYSTNKVLAENQLKKILPKQHLILRTWNILWNFTKRKWYKTFMGWISDSIREAWCLSVSENPQTKKDFISKKYFQYALSQLIKQSVLGTINVGAWFAISLKELLENICWCENVIFNDNLPEPRDQFILNVEKLTRYINRFSYNELINQCEKTKQSISISLNAQRKYNCIDKI